ncbi:hypothetical protein [Nostoc sp.]|uniref:hypothetical protein n=1 Tax=Nostoc sp. TaxID=1180 RepID=UPI002FFC7FFB
MGYCILIKFWKSLNAIAITSSQIQIVQCRNYSHSHPGAVHLAIAKLYYQTMELSFPPTSELMPLFSIEMKIGEWVLTSRIFLIPIITILMATIYFLERH